MTGEISAFDDGTDDRFAASVLELRKARGWSQDQLAEKMMNEGIRDATALLVSRIEKKRRKVRLQEAVALSRIFQVPITSMTSQDSVQVAISTLFELTRRNQVHHNGLVGAAKTYAEEVPSTATTMLEQIAFLRSLDLDPDAVQAVRSFETQARKSLSESPAEIVSRVKWGTGEAVNVVTESGEIYVTLPLERFNEFVDSNPDLHVKFNRGARGERQAEA